MSMAWISGVSLLACAVPLVDFWVAGGVGDAGWEESSFGISGVPDLPYEGSFTTYFFQ